MKRVAVGLGLVLASVGMGSTAFAGEVGGSGKETAGPSHANSICVYSGLDDGSEGGEGGPGNPPQNWGQIPKDVRAVLKADGEYPGRACNGHLMPWQDFYGQEPPEGEG